MFVSCLNVLAARPIVPASLLIVACGGKVGFEDGTQETNPDASTSGVNSVGLDANAAEEQRVEPDASAVDVGSPGAEMHIVADGAAGTTSGVVPTCPSACMGGCDGGTCIITYNTEPTSQTASIVCPAGQPCEVLIHLRVARLTVMHSSGGLRLLPTSEPPASCNLWQADKPETVTSSNTTAVTFTLCTGSTCPDSGPLVSRRSNSLSIVRGVCFVVGDGEGRGVGDVGSGQGGAATMASIEHDA